MMEARMIPGRLSTMLAENPNVKGIFHEELW
jgi:hypothetical protein